MEYKKLLSRSDDWLKYAINLHLLHEPKETLAELRNATLADSRIQKFLADVSVFHGTLVTNHKIPIYRYTSCCFCWTSASEQKFPKSMMPLMKFLSIRIITVFISL